MRKNYTIFAFIVLLQLFAGCKSSHITEQQRFESSVMKEFPFRVDSVSWLSTGDLPTFKFANTGYVALAPDAEIRPDGDYWVANTFDAEPPVHQADDNIWRNIVVSRKKQRVMCIDRYLQQVRTVGYCYVLQSERKEYPRYGTLHWDVSDPRNVEMVGVMLDDLRELALKRRLLNDAELAAPASQINESNESGCVIIQKKR